MKFLSKFFTVALLLTLFTSCKETKKEDASVATETIEQAKAIETEIDNVTESLEKEAEDLDKSLDALDDI